MGKWLGSTRSPLSTLLFYALLLGGWQAICRFSGLADYVLPSPWQVALRLWEMLTDGLLWPSVYATLVRMVLGYGLAAALGLLIGTLMGVWPWANRTLRSFFLGLQTLPSAAWVPLALLLFGLKDASIYFVIVMSSTAAMAIATAEAIGQVPPVYLRAARCMGVPAWALPHRVILPAALPSLMTGLKLGWTLGWHGAVSAELIRSTLGLGFLLHMGREMSDMSQVVGIMLLTIALGLLADRLLFGWIQLRIARSRGLTPTPP